MAEQELPPKPSNVPPLYTEEDLAKLEARKKKAEEADPEGEETREQWRQRVLDRGARNPDHVSTPASRKAARVSESERLHNWARQRGPGGAQ